MLLWSSYPLDGKFYVAQSNERGDTLRTHPIPFDNEREAMRAVNRLNTRDAEAVPYAHMDEH